jgi:hypothetical protein
MDLYGPNGYWAQYDATIARIKDEAPPDWPALKAILRSFAEPSSGEAFFGDNDGDLPAALDAAGWDVRYEASYLWEARSPAGNRDWIAYTEGDISPGRLHRREP